MRPSSFAGSSFTAKNCLVIAHHVTSTSSGRDKYSLPSLPESPTATRKIHHGFQQFAGICLARLRPVRCGVASSRALRIIYLTIIAYRGNIALACSLRSTTGTANAIENLRGTEIRCPSRLFPALMLSRTLSGNDLFIEPRNDQRNRAHEALRPCPRASTSSRILSSLRFALRNRTQSL